jgi:hypothetical protein
VKASDGGVSPLTQLYGNMPSVKLSRAQAGAATFEQRFASIARFVAGMVRKFHGSLSPEGHVSFELDDVFTDCWIELREKNTLYDNKASSYIVFASVLVSHLLLELRERSRCVRMPANASMVLKAYDRKDSESQLTKPQRILYMQILASGRDHGPLRGGSDARGHAASTANRVCGPHDELEREEHEAAETTRLARQLCKLTTLECVTLSASLGLWGNAKASHREVSLEYGFSEKFVKTVLRRARHKLKIKARP